MRSRNTRPHYILAIVLLMVILSLSLACSAKTDDGQELFSDIPNAVASAVAPEDDSGGLCLNEETGNEVVGVFDENGRYFSVGFGRIQGNPNACVVQGNASLWRNRNPSGAKIDLRKYVFHSESKKAMPVRIEHYGGGGTTLAGYEAQTTIRIVKPRDGAFPTVTPMGR